MRGLVMALAALLAADDARRSADLERIRQTMAGELGQLPNYTCAETIERSGGDAKHKLRPIDTLRLNVAVVKGRELYAWPGGEFEDKGISGLVHSGFVSDGNFSVMPRKVFSPAARISYAGEEELDGREAARYDFSIPASSAGWQVSAGAAFARVGSKGSFWVDAVTLEVLRLDFAADGLPEWLQNKSLQESIGYARIRIGGREVLLPRSTEMRTESFRGERHVNHAVFSDCREYGSESTVRFDTDQDMLPANVSLRLRLETEIDSATAAVGDPLRATLLEPVTFKGGSLKDGASVTGAIVTVQRNLGSDPRTDLGIEWSRADEDGKAWNLQGKLIDVDTFPDRRRSLLESLYRSDASGSVVTVNGVLGKIPAGVTMTWRTTGPR